MRFFVLVCGSVAAFLMLKYRKQVKDFVGEVSFAEKFLGMGGTNTLIVLLAILTFIGSLMYALGTLQSILNATFGLLF